MVKKYLDKLSPKARLGVVAAAGVAIIGGCSLSVYKANDSGFFAEPKRSIATILDKALFKFDPGAYVAVSTHGFYQNPEAMAANQDDVNNFAYAVLETQPGQLIDLTKGMIREKPEVMAGYEQNLTELVLEVDNQGMLTGAGQVSMFESTAGKVPVETGIQICEAAVFSKTNANQNLEHVLGMVKEMELGDYAPILSEMGGKFYGDFTNKLDEIWPW